MTIFKILSQKFLKIVFIITSALLSLGVASVCVIAFMLARGPLDLSFLKSDLFKYLGVSQTKLDFNTLEAHLNVTEATLELIGKEISIKQPTKTIHHVLAQSCHFEFDIRGLIAFKRPLKSIKVQGLQIQVPKAPLSRGNHLVQYDFDQGALFKRLDELAAIKTLSVHDATINFVDYNGKVIQQLFLDAQIEQAKTRLQGNILIQSAPLKLSLALNHAKDTDLIKITGNLAGLGTNDIKTLFADILGAGIRFEDISLDFNLLYNRQAQKVVSQMEGKINHITLLSHAQAQHWLKIPHITFKAKLNNRTILLEKIQFALSGIPFTAQAQGYIDDANDQIHYKAKATAQHVPLQNLHHFWPQDAMHEAREWVLTHLTAGQLSHGAITIESRLDFSAKHPFFTLKKLEGQLQLKDATLTYLKTMPPITYLNADAHFDQNHFNLHIHAAQSQDISLTGGALQIGKFQDKIQRLTLKTQITGTLPAVLSLIDHPPLAYAQTYKLNKHSARGHVNGTLSLAFPLTLPFQADKLETEIQATLEKGYLDNLAGLNVTLKQGALKIDARKGMLRISGPALLNDLMTQIDFTQTKDAKQEVILKTTVTPQALSKFWPPSLAFFQGSIPLILTYTSALKGQGNLEIQGDLNLATLNLLTHEKPQGKPGHFSLLGKISQGELTEITDIVIKTDNNTVLKGHLSLLPPHKQGTFIWENQGKETLKVHMNFQDPNKTEINIKGATFDLSALQKLDFPLNTVEHSTHTTNVTLDAKKITFGQELGVLNNQLKMNIHKGQIQTLHYQGQVEGITAPKKGGITCDIFHNKAALRQLRGQCDAGGALLSRLNIMHNVKGGVLRILATYDPAFSTKDWIGKIKLENFSVLNAPFLTRFFSLVFPTGIADLSKDGGMKFKLLKLRFGLSSEALKIHGARAFGNSLGFSFHGTIHRGMANTIDLNGSMIPAYALNSFVANIPLIGRLLTGGKDEGFLGINFNVSGTSEKPKVTANPLSVLTPGILRKIFSTSNNEQAYDDIWLDQDIIKHDIFDQEFLLR